MQTALIRLRGVRALRLFGTIALCVAIAALAYNPYSGRLEYYPTGRGQFMAGFIAATIAFFWSVLLRKGLDQVVHAAVVSSGLFCALFGWQAVACFAEGLPGGTVQFNVPALLWGLLWAAAAVLLLLLLYARKQLKV